MIIVLGLPLNMATIILGCIFSMLLNDFRACGLMSILTHTIAALTEFFYADAERNVHPLPVSWHFISSLWRRLCSSTYTMSMLWSIADALPSGRWPILRKVLTLSVTIYTVLLHLSNFCFSLNSAADFSNTWVRAPISAGGALFFTGAKGNAVWTCGLSMSHGNLSMAVFYSHP